MENLGEFAINHWILVTLFVVLSGLVLSDSFNSKISGITSIGTAQAIQIINQRNGLFVDVREASEFSKSHISDSENMPMTVLADKLSTLKDSAQPIILVCASGQRARSAAKQLQNNAFSEVYVLAGGINTWKEAKLPLFS